GIPDVDVSDIAIDESGLGVIALNYAGISIFDETEWTNYDTSNSPLPDNLINTIAVDSENNIWIGTETAGLVVFDRGLWDHTEMDKSLLFQIFPNPASDKIVLTNNFYDAEIKLYDVTGKIIFSRQIKSSLDIIDIKNIAEGIYFISVQNKGMFSVKQFLIQH
ncbi:MAG: T9SS type A sorting domain-containing protein, partial [Fimbriimonadaceae bacterium]|nr:T9SS type A sorting domain-containing protein [Chitinophagales bacterium]